VRVIKTGAVEYSALQCIAV